MILATLPNGDTKCLYTLESIVSSCEDGIKYDYRQRTSKTRRICRTYNRIKKRSRREPMPFKAAFSNSQFEEMMRDWGLDAKKDEDLKQIVSIGYGCYTRKCDIEELLNKMEQSGKRIWNFVSKNIDNLIVSMRDEMANIEWCINMDDRETKFNNVWEALRENNQMDESTKYIVQEIANRYYYNTLQ